MYLYRFMIGKGTATGPRAFTRMFTDSLQGFFEHMPEGLRGSVDEHYVGVQWEVCDGEYFQYVLLDDEFTQVACELWFPRSYFSQEPDFVTRINRCGSPCPTSGPSSPHETLPRHRGGFLGRAASTSQTAW